jgi:hypothetical protein
MKLSSSYGGYEKRFISTLTLFTSELNSFIKPKSIAFCAVKKPSRKYPGSLKKEKEEYKINFF